MCSAGKRAAATAMWDPGNFSLRLVLLHILPLHWNVVAISAFGPNISRSPAIFRLPIVKLRAAVLITRVLLLTTKRLFLPAIFRLPIVKLRAAVLITRVLLLTTKRLFLMLRFWWQFGLR